MKFAFTLKALLGFIDGKFIFSPVSTDSQKQSALSHAASEHLNASLMASGSVCQTEAKRLLGSKENLNE